jgi:hypothetical protein
LGLAARIERGIVVFQKRSFLRLLCLALVLSFIAGFAVFILSGATTNKGTTGAIASEYSAIMSAEKASCHSFGSYGSIATLRREGLLTFKPTYNSVVLLPGAHCGTVIVGSPAYQSSSG